MISLEETPIEWLSEPAIRDQLEPLALRQLSRIEIFQSMPSTNTYLMTLPEVSSGQVCLAEEQSAGKGRAGRQWVSPLGRSIALSLAWQFPSFEVWHQALPLVVGVSVAQALETYGAQGVGIKWPNDIICHQRKLGGVLVEMKTLETSEAWAVMGVGINLAMSRQEGAGIDQPWTDIERVLQEVPPRNALVGQILNTLLQNLPLFTSQGLLPFLDAWRAYDALQGQRIVIRREGAEIVGVAMGVDHAGWIVVNVDGVIKKFNSGEVSVRWQI